MIWLIGCATKANRIIYVNTNVQAGGDGSTWTLAYQGLQDALDIAVKGDEIWVAAGTYTPTQVIGGDNSRHKSFLLKKGVAVYGGFAGNETNREERGWDTHKTILSGDLNGDDEGFTNNRENCFHVVIGNKADASSVLDGFHVTGGNANADVWPNDGGGGMSNFEGSPTIRHCWFHGNAAFADGGGMRNWGKCKSIILNCMFTGNRAEQEGGGMMNGPGSSPTVINCVFRENSAGEDGGGVYVNESRPVVTNCIFTGNSAELTGGGMYTVNGSTPLVTNCTFSGNSAMKSGGSLFNNRGNPTLSNCILWGNSASDASEIGNHESTPIIRYSNIAGGYKGDGNIASDPLFRDESLRLLPDSPCIDAGDNSALPVSIKTDLDTNPRIANEIVDMGAYELTSTK